MEQSILIFGASDSVIGMTKTAKLMGYKIAMLGPDVSSVARSMADYYKIVDDNQIDEVVEFAKEKNVVAIVPLPIDRILQWQAKIADVLGLIFISVDDVDNFRDKYKMKETFIRNGVNCANGVIIKNLDDYNSKDLSKLLFPLIVKPIDGYASRGVTKVENIKELDLYVVEAFEFSISGKILIEEFIEGREFNSEGIVFNGEVQIIAIVEKIRDPFPRTIEMGHIVPPDITNDEETIIFKEVTKAVSALNLKNGAFNAEIKIYNGNGYIIEVNGRLAGDFIVSDLIKPTTGYDMEEAVVNISLGIKPKDYKYQYCKSGIIRFFNLPESKKIDFIQDYSIHFDKTKIIKYHLFYKIGDITPKVRHMGNRAGFLINVDENIEKTIECSNKCIEIFKNSIKLS